MGIDGDAVLGSQASSFEHADRAQVDGGHGVAEFGKKHPVAALAITDAQRATNRELVGNFTEKVVWLGAERKTILRVALVPALAARRRSRHEPHAITVAR